MRLVRSPNGIDAAPGVWPATYSCRLRLLDGALDGGLWVVEIVPLVDEGLGNSSYLVDPGVGRALVIDPARDASVVRRLADERRLTIEHSVETHLHADFVSGSRELAARGATVLAPRAGDLAFPHRGLSDGDELYTGFLQNSFDCQVIFGIPG